MQFFDSPGNIRNQIGASLSAIREATAQGDVFKVADQVRLLVALASPKLGEANRDELEVPDIEPGRDKDGSKERKLFKDCMTILEKTLSALAQEGIYAKMDAPLSDGSSLAVEGDEPDPSADVPI